jgi:hypothetical protein
MQQVGGTFNSLQMGEDVEKGPAQESNPDTAGSSPVVRIDSILAVLLREQCANITIIGRPTDSSERVLPC